MKMHHVLRVNLSKRQYQVHNLIKIKSFSYRLIGKILVYQRHMNNLEKDELNLKFHNFYF